MAVDARVGEGKVVKEAKGSGKESRSSCLPIAAAGASKRCFAFGSLG